MAIWLQQAILAENVSVRRDGSRIYLPVGPDFQLKEEIKNVITAIAKTHHYWQEHLRKQRNNEKKGWIA
jgi:sirohydrochlorin cobaltochelatase